MKTSGSTSLVLNFTKSTKNTHVYSCDAQDAAIKSLYVERSSLPKEPPKKIEVTVEWE